MISPTLPPWAKKITIKGSLSIFTTFPSIVSKIIPCLTLQTQQHLPQLHAYLRKRSEILSCSGFLIRQTQPFSQHCWLEHSRSDSTHMFPALLQHQPVNFCTPCNQLERASKRWDENFPCSLAIRLKHPIKLHICTAILICLSMGSKSEQMHCREQASVSS